MDEKRLTSDQTEVVRLMVLGFSDRHIARRLDVSVSTVQRRIRAAAKALDAPSRVRLGVLAMQMGLLGNLNDADEKRHRQSEGIESTQVEIKE